MYSLIELDQWKRNKNISNCGNFHIDVLAQDCGNSSALAMELL